MLMRIASSATAQDEDRMRAGQERQARKEAAIREKETRAEERRRATQDKKREREVGGGRTTASLELLVLPAHCV